MTDTPKALFKNLLWSHWEKNISFRPMWYHFHQVSQIFLFQLISIVLDVFNIYVFFNLTTNLVYDCQTWTKGKTWNILRRCTLSTSLRWSLYVARWREWCNPKTSWRTSNKNGTRWHSKTISVSEFSAEILRRRQNVQDETSRLKCRFRLQHNYFREKFELEDIVLENLELTEICSGFSELEDLVYLFVEEDSELSVQHSCSELDLFWPE
jgi:hypothetical protein